MRTESLYVKNPLMQNFRVWIGICAMEITISIKLNARHIAILVFCSIHYGARPNFESK